MAKLPDTITKIEEVRYDEYSGPLADLIAAGLVRQDQLPPEGRTAISWRNGIQQSRNVRRDEHYLRVMLKPRGQATLWVGVSAEVAAPRAKAAREAWEAEWQARDEATKREADAKDRAEKAALAKRDLASVPKSGREYLLKKVEHIRSMTMIYLQSLDQETTWHGYRMSTETKEAAMVAIDAIVEALIQGEVIFDAALHEQCIAGFRAKARAADPSFERQFVALSAPNPSILSGEQA